MRHRQNAPRFALAVLLWCEDPAEPRLGAEDLEPLTDTEAP